MMNPNCWWGHHGFFGMPVAGMALTVIFWLLVLYAVYVLASALAKRSKGPAVNEESAMDLLKKRYARGEMDAEEFARKKKDIDA